MLIALTIAGLARASDAQPLASTNPLQPPRIAIVGPPASRPVPATLREDLTQAFDLRGMTVVPLPTRLPRATTEALAATLAVDGVVEVELSPAPFLAHLRVVTPQGDVPFEATLPIAGPRLTRDEAGTLASLTLQSLVPTYEPPEPRTSPAPPPGPPSVAGVTPMTKRPSRTLRPNPETAEIEPPAAPATPNVLPDPETLRLTRLSAAPTIGFRSFDVQVPNGAPPTRQQASQPFPGLALRADIFPFSGALASRLGFGLQYGFALLDLDTPGVPLQHATEQRFNGDVIGRFPKLLFGGDVDLRLGVAYQGFFVPDSGPYTTLTHLAPRLGVEYRHELPKSLRIEARGGILPFSVAGSQAEAAFGTHDGGWGADAGIGVSGPVDFVLPGLRWTAGYDVVRFSQDYRSAAGQSHTDETDQRILLGLSFEQRR
jgi:hypothetical protein